MAKDTAIEWADATWNPWMGCTKVSDGCVNCYMYREQERYGHDPSVLRRSKTTFKDPLKWKEPCTIFVCSWSDFFHKDVPTEWRKDAMEIMYQAPQHTYLLLTKRPGNVRLMLRDEFWKVNPHVWLGVTAENQVMADLRIPTLLQIPAAKHFVSVEPMLGPVDIFQVNDLIGFGKEGVVGSIDWMIAGGESGPDFRVMEEEWAIDLRDQCVAAEVPFFFKQHSGLHPKKDPRGMLLDGQLWTQKP